MGAVAATASYGVIDRAQATRLQRVPPISFHPFDAPNARSGQALHFSPGARVFRHNVWPFAPR
jgi:hypothetical protein